MGQRIVKLQKTLAKRAEKEEFLEEHINQLVAELQKKNKIIDFFVAKEEPGVMTQPRDDAIKVKRSLVSTAEFFFFFFFFFLLRKLPEYYFLAQAFANLLGKKQKT